MSDTTQVLALATELAKRAGKIIQDYLQNADHSDVSVKSNDTLVTEADTQINQMVIDAIREKFPEHGVLGEEQSFEDGRNELWVCDPIDGTHSLIQGIPVALFSIAYVVNGQPEVAVTYDPFQDLLLTAVRNQGAFRNGQKTHVSTTDALNQATVAATASFGQLKQRIQVYDTLANQGVNVLLVPGNVFKSQLLAQGFADGYIFPGQSAHDIAAAALIITEAGGKVTDLDGNDQRYDGKIRGAILSNGHIHGELVKAVATLGSEQFLGY